MQTNFAHIPKPRRPVKADRLKQEIYKHCGESQESFEWGAKNVNFLMEVMKFMPRNLRESFSGLNPENAIEADYLSLDDNTVISSTGKRIAPESDNSAGASVSCSTFADIHHYKSMWGAAFPGINSGRAYQNVNFNPMITEFNHIKAESLKDKEDNEVLSANTCSDLDEIDIFSSTPNNYKAASAYNGRNLTIHGQAFGARASNTEKSFSANYSGGIGNLINNDLFNKSMATVKDYTNMSQYGYIETGHNKDISCQFNNYWDIAINRRYDDFDSSETTKGEHAFGLMASMIESRRRYIGAMSEIFGDTVDIFNDQAMIQHMEDWITDEKRGGRLSPHTASMYMMFFQGQIILHRHFYPFFGDVDDAGYRHGGTNSNFTGDRVKDYKKWLAKGAKDYAGYGSISKDVITRTGTGELGIDLTQFTGQNIATVDAMKAKINEIISFMQTIEAADRQAEIDRVKVLPLTIHQNDDVIKNTHRKNIANEVKNILWSCIERSGDQQQWSVKDLFAKDAGGTNMSNAVKTSINSIVSKMNDAETSEINSIQSKSIDSYISSLNLSACKKEMVNAISDSCLKWSPIGGYYVKSDIQVFEDVPVDKVWGNSLDPNSSDPIVQKKL
ncbi:MAG: hypothetical protein ABIH39_03360, partial [Candidatus Margulisiibacteriota bacterium]